MSTESDIIDAFMHAAYTGNQNIIPRIDLYQHHKIFRDQNSEVQAVLQFARR
jgi:hypothetical protein